MSNKLIQDLASAAVLVTDLIEHQPIAGPPSKKGTVTALFSDAGGNVVMDRDNRQLVDSLGNVTVSWNSGLLKDSGGLNSVNWESHVLCGLDGAGVIDYANGDFYQTGNPFSCLNWFTRMLFDAGSLTSVKWDGRQLIGADGATVILDWNAQQTSGADLTNNVTAGGTDDVIANYTSLTVYATDAAAIRNDIYQLARKLKQINDGLRALGLFT